MGEREEGQKGGTEGCKDRWEEGQREEKDRREEGQREEKDRREEGQKGRGTEGRKQKSEVYKWTAFNTLYICSSATFKVAFLPNLVDLKRRKFRFLVYTPIK